MDNNRGHGIMLRVNTASGLLVLLLFFGCPRLALSTEDQPTSSEPESADTQQLARELYNEGAVHYEEGRYEEAITLWQRSWELSQAPLLLFNMGNAHERIANWAEARRLLQQYHELAPAEERETIRRRIENLDERIAERQRATAVSPPVEQEDGSATDPAPPAPLLSDDPGGLSTLQWILLSTTVVALGTGTVFAVLANSDANDIETACSASGDGWLCPANAQSSIDSGARNALLADLCIGLGIVSAATFIVTLVLDSPPDQPEGSRTSLVPTLHHRGAGFLWQIRF